MTDSKSTLQEFGLTEKEASVYLMLIKSGSSTANEIASKTKVHRVNLYDILGRLQKKGLVSYVILGKRKHYEASEPKKILELEEERKQNAINPTIVAVRPLGLKSWPVKRTVVKRAVFFNHCRGLAALRIA